MKKPQQFSNSDASEGSRRTKTTDQVQTALENERKSESPRMSIRNAREKSESMKNGLPKPAGRKHASAKEDRKVTAKRAPQKLPAQVQHNKPKNTKDDQYVTLADLREMPPNAPNAKK